MTLTIRCPAKINTFLAVGPPDARGYHPLRTIFQAISLCDTLTLTLSDREQWTSNWPELPAENTMTKAMRLVSEYVDPPPLHIHLEKAIPAESGLGGGSSDAAGLLRGLMKILPHLENHFVQDVAASVGADVPFFLVGGRAKGEGYGERLTPLPDAPSEWLVLVRPPVGVSTASAYQQLDSAPRPFAEFPTDDRVLYNDFERVSPCICGEIAERLQAARATGALLSGSGSAVFGRFDSASAAEEGAEKIKAENLGEVWVATTLSREESLWISSS